MSVISRQIISVESQARDMWSSATEDEPAIVRTYWFPADDEVRLVYVDETAAPTPKVEPFYFGGNASEGRPYNSAIALVRPEEAGHLDLPKGWSEWADAVILDVH